MRRRFGVLFWVEEVRVSTCFNRSFGATGRFCMFGFVVFVGR